MNKIPKLSSPKTPESIRQKILPRIILVILVILVAVGCTEDLIDKNGFGGSPSEKPEPAPEPIGPDTPATPRPDPEPIQDSKPPQFPPCLDPVPASVTTDNSDRQIVSIPDAGLETAVKSRLGKGGNDPIHLHEMTKLTRLFLPTNDNVKSLEGLQYAENLTELSAGYNSICDLSPLSDLTKLERLWISGNSIDLDSQMSVLEELTSLKNLHLQGLYTRDLSFISRLTDLEILYLGFSDLPDLSPLRNLVNLKTLFIVLGGVSDISALSSLAELIFLDLESNQISDLSPLASLQNLANLSLRYNNVTDISPLVSNSGLGSGDRIELRDNPLDSSSAGSYIPQLLARGANVLFDEVLITAEDEPQIYKNNVFVMPVDADIASGPVQYESLTTVFYERFEDVFNFLIIVYNLRRGEFRPGYLGSSLSVTNDVGGIGKRTYSDDRYGSDGKLKSIVNLVEYDGIREGPLLHELIHQWGNDITRPFGHWGYTSADGQLGGFARENFEDLGDGRYAAGHFPPLGYANQAKPYSPIELYLAGFVPADDVPDLLVAEDASLVFEEGNLVKTQEGYPVFTAVSITNLTIEDIIAEHGERVPGVSDSQKDFRAAVIFLIDENHHATRNSLTP